MKTSSPLLLPTSRQRLISVVVLVAATLHSTANLVAATHDDVAVNRASNAVNCYAYDNYKSDYMNKTCSNGDGGKTLPPPGEGPEGCVNGTLACDSWKYVTKGAGCASFIQQYEDGTTDGKKYFQKQCCDQDEFFPAPAPSPPPPNNCDPNCGNTASPYMQNIGLTCEVAARNKFYTESRCNNEIENVGPNAGDPNPWVFNWRQKGFCRQMCFEAGVGYEGDNCCVGGVTPDACNSDVKTCWDGRVLSRDPADNCNFPDCRPCNPEEKQCPKPDGSGYYTLTTSIYDGCRFAACESCDSPQRKTCWNGSVIKKDPDTCRWESHCAECGKKKHQCWDGSWAWPEEHNCQWARQCPPCDKKAHVCWNGDYAKVDPHTCTWINKCPPCDKKAHVCWNSDYAKVDPHTCTWINKCPPPVICPYDTVQCWDGSVIGRNAHNCHFPNCPDRPNDIPGYNDVVQIEAVTKDSVDLCMNVDGDKFKEDTTIEFDGCDEDDISQKFHVRRIYHTDNTRFYIVPEANTNLYVTAVDVDPNASGTQGRLRLQKKGDGKQVFFLDYADDPTNDHFKLGLGSVCYPSDSSCLFVSNNGDKAEDNNRIVVRTWNRIEANARSGVRSKTIFGTWKINTLRTGGNHHRNLRHGRDVNNEE